MEYIKYIFGYVTAEVKNGAVSKQSHYVYI